MTGLDTVTPRLFFPTYLGGSGEDRGAGVGLDRMTGRIFITGQTGSLDFPQVNPFQPGYGGSASDAFVTAFNAQGRGLFFSSFLGGSGFDRAFALAVDSTGAVVVTGRTSSPDFPTVKPIQDTWKGNYDAFMTKIAP